MIFNNSAGYSGSTLLLGVLFFTFQIYADFSGYSDIAIGTAKLFNIDLLRNFAFPYFSRNISEFWRRWHISLSSWFRDYIYIPLGGSNVSTLKTIRNVFVLFLVSGLWHGANWTFIVWGLLHAMYILPSIIFKSNAQTIENTAHDNILPTIKESVQMLATFSLIVFAWIFFRAENITHAFNFVSGIFSVSIFTKPEVLPMMLFLLTGICMLIEWIGRNKQYALAPGNRTFPRFIRWALYYIIIFSIFHFAGPQQQFIYFQF